MGGLDGAVDVDCVVVSLVCEQLGMVEASLSSPFELVNESCEPSAVSSCDRACFV
jgi:hypothetical protein